MISIIEMRPLGTTKLNSQYGTLGSSEHFLERATDALSVIKISNSYLRTTLGAKNPDAKTSAAFSMIEKAVLKIEAFLDDSKQQERPTSIQKVSPRSTKSIKKTVFPLTELLKMSIPKNLPSNIKINLPKNDFELSGDFYKLVVVISNIIQNSIDAMKNNGVINIFARESNGFIIAEIKDSGPGIPSEIVNKIFSSLYTTKPDGNGLGLKMAKTIIDAHGGSIAVRNNPTTFTIKLPK